MSILQAEFRSHTSHHLKIKLLQKDKVGIDVSKLAMISLATPYKIGSKVTWGSTPKDSKVTESDLEVAARSLFSHLLDALGSLWGQTPEKPCEFPDGFGGHCITRHVPLLLSGLWCFPL